jgi:hypothetical protein
MRKRVSHRARLGLLTISAILMAGGATATFAASSSPGTGSTSLEGHAEAPAYHAPEGALLPDAQLDEIAHREAALAQDGAPSEIRAVDASMKSAMEIDPHNVMPPPSDPGMTSLEASTVVVVSMHGSFKLANARVPSGRPAPTGSVLTLILDAHTGQLEGRAVTDEDPPGLTALGTRRGLE